MITLAISHKPRVTEKTVLSGDSFFQLQAVALALLRVVRLAAGFLVHLGVVIEAAEAGCMGAGTEPSGTVAGALLRAISWLTRQRQLSEMFSHPKLLLSRVLSKRVPRQRKSRPTHSKRAIA